MKKCLKCGVEFNAGYYDQELCRECLEDKYKWDDIESRPCHHCFKSTIQVRIGEWWYCLNCKRYEK